MTNFQYLFAAWMVVWAIFFVYQISIGARIAAVKKDIQELKRQLNLPL